MLLDIKDANDKYGKHKSTAKQRGVDFKLTFEQWMTIWLQSGQWLNRGKGRGKYNMSRKNDTGAYEEGNVFIQDHEANSSDGHRGIPKTPEQNLKNSLSNKAIDHSKDWMLKKRYKEIA